MFFYIYVLPAVCDAGRLECGWKETTPSIHETSL